MARSLERIGARSISEKRTSGPASAASDRLWLSRADAHRRRGLGLGRGEQVGPVLRERLLDPSAGLAQLGDRLVEVLALPLEGHDALAEPAKRCRILRRPPVLLVVEVEDLANLGQ